MSFSQGLSGLNAASQKLSVIGNNIANLGTVGFKSSAVSFADVYANSRVGLGVQVASVNQDFSTGAIISTGNQFDVAIDGPTGLFRVEDSNGRVLYTRNGQFHADKNNFIVNAQGQRLTGYAVGTTNLMPIKVPVGNIEPLATTNIDYKVNLDANAAVVTVPFDATDPSTFSFSSPITVFDSLGNQHSLIEYFTKRPAVSGDSAWDVNFTVDGATPTSGANTTLAFDTAGRLITAPPIHTVGVTNPGGPSSPAAPLNITVDYTDSTQFGGDYTQNFTQNGYATGEYTSMSISDNGSIIANYTNGQIKDVGTLALADFNNLQGLKPVGGNAWVETAASGQPILGQPGSNGLANIKSQAVEKSNVDMSQELVHMIIAQRAYQANAKTIETQDQILQTLITMR
ncbi:MAG: flagellar hook protein FlgE [Nitrosospira sp.]|nr:flagellar hook protein FlgE [Nitrosospira sp.]